MILILTLTLARVISGTTQQAIIVFGIRQQISLEEFCNEFCYIFDDSQFPRSLSETLENRGTL